MGGEFHFFDIIILAMIAGFLILRLRSVLGRRTGNERPPPDDVVTHRRQDANADGNVVDLPDRGHRDQDLEEDSATAAQTIDGSDPFAAALTQIQIADNSFNPREFVGGARSAFEMVVHAFATGDSGTLRNLLSDDVFDNFSSAIKARLEAAETLETTVIGVKSVDIIDARLDGRLAFVTVKFVSEQVNVTRDAEGHVIDGDPNHVSEVTDLWTFSRNTRSRDPNWKLVETRSPN